MARKKRIWYPGAVYHLMSRGNRHQEIFREPSDYEFFLTLLRNVEKRYPFDIHSYCLMTNHFHFLMETKDVEIWRIMKRLQEVYSGYFNSKYGLDGHLFQGRYKSCLVEDDAYFLQISRYIHLNPVKAGMVVYPEDYRWSSYQALICTDERPLVTTEKVWSYFARPENVAYRLFVEENSLNTEVYEKEIRTGIGEDETWLPW